MPAKLRGYKPGMEALDAKNDGNGFFKSGDWANAIKCYSRAVKHDNMYHVPYSNRSMAYYKLGKYKEAAQDGQWCIQCEPGFVKGYHRAANAYVSLGDYKNAMAILKTAYKNGHRTDDNLNDLDEIVRPKYTEIKLKEKMATKGAMRAKLEGNDLFEDSEYDKAIVWYTKGIKLAEPKKADTEQRKIMISCLLNRAICWQQQANWNEMVGDCTYVLELEPTEDQQAKALFRRAMGLENKEKFRSALADIQQITRNPRFSGWAEANSAQNRLNRAVRTLKSRGVKI